MDEVKRNGDGLEQLAREAAEGAQFELNPSAWNAMEQKLDAPKKGFFWWKLGGGLGLLAIIVLLIVMWPSGTIAGDDTSKTSLEEEALPKKSESTEQVADIDNKQDGAPGADENPKSSLAAQTKENTEASTVQRTIDTDSQQRIASSKQSLNLKNLSNQGKEESNATSDIKNDREVVTSKSKVVETASVARNSSLLVSYFEPSQPIGTLDSIESQMTSLYEVGVETLALRWVPRIFLFDQSIQPMIIDSSYYQAADLDSLQTFKRWSFGAMVSLDLSATGLDGFTDPGNMLGLLAEYRISKKWSIQSGLSYSVKNYAALGGEYDTSTWPGGRSDNLVSALARCLVLDIPINIRRYFQAKNGNQWFVSSGVSTYLMLSEDYNYEYATQNPNWSSTSQVRGENNHFFGIANFSVGYETPISKKLGLAFEPFMKLPLTGIGQGKVKFLSFGANVAIKLR